MRCNVIIDTGTYQIVSTTSQHMLKVSVRYGAVRFDAVKFDVSRDIVAVVRWMYILCSI